MLKVLNKVPKKLDYPVIRFCVNEEKVTVAGCSTGSKEFLRQKVEILDVAIYLELLKDRLQRKEHVFILLLFCLNQLSY